jgi:hypothetical protein
MTDAKAAIWVIGGKKQGVMTSVAKWAFAKKEDAENFREENGGEISTFNVAMDAAGREANEEAENGHAHHSHGGHNMGPGSQMLYNPAFGDDVYHTHPAGMLMFNYKLMHMDMRGLANGDSNVDQSKVGYRRNLPYNYMMVPTSMTMNMHMVMAMYGITDRLTAMAMANYQETEMKMLMDMGPGRMRGNDTPMRTVGFGDTEVRGIYKICNILTGSLGLSFPTGSIGKEFTTMRTIYRAPYDMQLGSGTYDLKPAITYNDLSGDQKWNWGAQAMYTAHVGRNDHGWRLGNTLKATSWLQRALGQFNSWVRLAYTDTGKIKGKDAQIDKLIHPTTGMGAPMPDADPNNYGGRKLDGLIGLGFAVGPVSLGIEGGVPLYQYLNGLQMKTQWVLNTGIQIMF